MSYASDHIFGFPIEKVNKEAISQPSQYKRGSMGWCNEMVYEYEKECIQLKKENYELRLRIKELEER